MKSQKIKTLKDWQPVSLNTFVASIRRKQRRSGPLSGIVVSSPTVKAEINYGNWIARCPFCTGAELVDPEDPRFYCLSCDMKAINGQWLQVEMPTISFRQKLEAELLKRPRENNRNWLPGETLTRIKQENKERGGWD